MRIDTGISVSFLEVEPAAETTSTILLLHPWLESADAFSMMLQCLGSGLRILAPDLRGSGASDKPAYGYELPSLAADVVAFMDATEAVPAVLVGASSGGYIAQEVAASHPDLVTALVLAGAPRSLHGRTPPFAPQLERLSDPIDAGWARAFTESFAPRGGVPEAFVAARVRDALAVPAGIWRESLEALIRSAPPESELISAPTLVVSGRRDELLDRDAEELVRHIPRARVVEYAGAGHVIHWEQPKRLAQDVEAFAREVFERQ